MFERYSQESRRAVFFARAEALARDAAAIATTDLLLGLAHEPSREGCPFSMLHERRDELRALVAIPPMLAIPGAKNIPLSREAKIALAYAGQESDRDSKFRHGSIMRYHLLRGIVLGGDATAIALINLGWNIDVLRKLSIESMLHFPPKRPPLPKLIKYYRGPIACAVALCLLALLIFYLRWQQRFPIQ